MLKVLMKSHVMESLLAFVIRLSGGMASYALFAVISRTTGPSAFGSFSVAFSFAMTAGLVGSFGQQTFFVKEVPKAQEIGRPDYEKGVYIYALVSTGAVALASALALSILAHYRPETRGNAILIASTSALSFLYAVSQTTIGGLRIQNKVLYAIATRDLLWRVAAIAAIYLTYACFQPASGADLSISTIMFLLAICLAPIVALHLYQITSHARRAYKNVKAKLDPRAWTDTSLGLVLIAVISSSDLYIYTIILGNTLGQEEAGAFFASLKTVELLNMFLMAVTLVTAPEISKAVAARNRDRFQRVCNRSLVLQGAPAILATFLIILAAPLFMYVFDPSYVAYSNLLRLLAVGMLVNALTGATVLILQLIGKHWRQVFYQGGSLLLSIALLPVLMTHFHIYGVAIAFILSKVVWNVLAIVEIRKDRDVDPSLFGLLDKRSGGLRAVLNELKMPIKAGKISQK